MIIPDKNRLRSTFLLVLLAGMYLTACSQIVSSEKEQSSENGSSPYFMIISEESGTEQMPLKSTKVDVVISGVIANVEVNQVYANTGENPIEAIYVFPASTRAAVHDMTIKIGDREIIALIEEKKQARKMYENAKSEGKVASLLEEHRANVFQMNVANIMPGATIEVKLSYTELLVPTDKIYEFIYPTVVGPRYVSKGEIEKNIREEWTANPYLQEGEPPLSSLKINVELNSGMPIQSVRCETHANEINYQSKKSALLTTTKAEEGNRDFVLQYQLAGNSIETGVLVYDDIKGEKYFLAMLQPPKYKVNTEIPPREYVFIVDVSGSMSGFPLEVSKNLMQNLLSQLKEQDKFNIVFFAGGAQVYAEQSVSATSENISAAINYMNNTRGSGGTELLNALNTAMNLNSDDNFSRSFLILTDGYISVEKQAFDYIRNNLGKANFFSFGIGSSVNRLLIEGMAHVGYGEPFIALNKQEATKQANKFISLVSKPALTNIKTSFNGFEAYDMLPETVPDLFADRPIIISGKYKGSLNGTISIKGTSGGKTITKTLSLKGLNSKGNKGLKYLWAREKVRLTSDYNNLRDDEKTRNEIINLGKKYNLLTEYTSFIAIDSEISNKDGKSATVKQPLPLPEGVSNNAVGSSAIKAGYGSFSLKRYASPPPPQQVKNIESVDMEFDSEEEQVSEEIFFSSVENQPQFKGKGLQEFQKYIQSKVKYPEEAAEAGIEGKVFVQFTVSEQGKIIDIKVLRSPSDLLSNEVIKQLKNATGWTPGMSAGKPVKVQYTIPISFSLSK